MDAGPQERLRRAVIAVTGHAFTEGNAVTVLRNGDEIFPAMLEEMRAAEESIELVTFVYWSGDIARQVASALSDRARAGVRVRVVLDAYGSGPMDDDLVEQMRTAGAAVDRFRRLTRWKLWEADHRTHRKILVCDNRVAFTGGVGIAEEWEGDARDPSEWRDTHFRVEGPAVAGLRAAFLSDWRDMGHPLEPIDVWTTDGARSGDIEAAAIDGSANVGLNDAELLLEAVLEGAERRIIIQTPYFNPTDRVTGILAAALRRQVEVDVMIPGPHIDKRISRFMAKEPLRPLIANGARVWQFQPSMLHVKAVLVDDCFAVVGSVNLNRRSVHKDEEVALAVLSPELTATLTDHFEADRSRSMPLSDARQNPIAWAVERVLSPLRGEM
jgi:cardiolipin synthase A/B